MSTPSKTDLMYEILYNWEFVPRPSPKVNVKTMVVDGKRRYFMKNHIMGTLYELDKLSYYIWGLIDGKRTMAEIAAKMRKTKPDVQLSTVLQTLLFYAESGALQAVLELTRKKRVRVDPPFKVYVSIVERSKDFLESIHRLIKPLLRRKLLWVSLAFILLIGLAFASQFIHILGDRRNFEIFGSTVVGIFVFHFIILAPVTAVHEIAHGLAVVHYGGAPKDMGTGWFYFGPMFYCDATDAWTFSRRNRIMVMLAGNLSTMLIGSAIVVAVYVWPFPAFISSILSITAFWCFYTSLWNFAPPFETDGYYVLSDLLNMPHLRHDAFAYLKTVVKRSLKKPVKEFEGLSVRKKRIFLGYAVMSVVWLTYMAYQSSVLMRYMAQDAAISFLKISSAILFNQTLSVVVFAVSVTSIAYFTMMVSGYVFIFVIAIKKVAVRALRFEAIHDRDLSVFLCLPTQVPKSLVNDLKTKMTKEAKRFARNFNIERVGPLCIAVLRMGGTELGLAQIKEHMGKIELTFSSMYEKFLHRHEHDIIRSAGIYGPQKIKLTNLLIEMAKEFAETGTPEAKAVVKQVIQDETRATFYLMHSVSGKVWTIELPPAQKYKIQKTLFPTLSVEDLSITDLYDEVEDFKKRIIYGFDSLAKLAAESQTGLLETLAHPDEYQVVALFQPVKGRLIIVGRTEQIEKNLAAFGSFFIDQAWCGYMDALLSETSHMLYALDRTTFPDVREIQGMSDAELTVLNKNLSTIIANEDFIESLLEKCEGHLKPAMNNIEELKKGLETADAFKVGLLDAIFALNAENLKNLPKRFKNFGEAFQRRRVEVRRMKDLVEKEHQKRKVIFSKKRRRITRIYPLLLVLSAVVALAGVPFVMEPVAIVFLVAALFPQLVYWAIYLLMRRSFHKMSRYCSRGFSQIQVFVFALTQAFYKFIATGDILTPSEATIKQRPMEIREAE